MKRWFLIEKYKGDDGCLSQQMKATDANEALAELRKAWESNPPSIQKELEGFYAYHDDSDGGGCMKGTGIDAVISLRSVIPIDFSVEDD